MDNLILEKTKQTPEIVCNYELGRISVVGRSLPENVKEAYSTLNKWVTEYTKTPKDDTIIDFDVEYVNSSSNRFFFSVLKSMEDLKQSGKSVTVNWYYDEDDDDILNLGNDYSGILQVKFNIIKK